MKNPARTRSVRSPGSGAPALTRLVLLRHGDAGDALAAPERDALRLLTHKGVKQARRAGKALARMGLTPRDVFTSRLTRAAQTAAQALHRVGSGARVTPTATLAPDAAPERILRTLVETPPPPPPDDRRAPASARGRRASRTGHRSRRPIEPAPIVRWLVGHDPHLARLAALALGTAPAALRLPKGAFSVIAFDGRGPAAGAGTLLTLLDPDALRALTRRRSR